MKMLGLDNMINNNETHKNLIDKYKPKGYSDYLFDAWFSCLNWSLNSDQIQERFKTYLKGKVYKEDILIEKYIKWFNKNIWGG